MRLAFVLLLLASCSQPLASKRVFVRLPISSLTADFVHDSGFIRDEKVDDTFAFGYLQKDKVPADAQILDEITRKRHNWDAKTLELLPDPPAAKSYEDYHNYTALTAELNSLAAAHPRDVVVESAGKSVKGKELWFVRISKDVVDRLEKPKLLLIANMHGDETVGRELMIYLARQILTETDIFNYAETVIMPSMNPDGYESDDRWNASGDDLNRSFPDFTSDPSDTPSNRPAEVKAIMKMHESELFPLAINFHGGAVCFNLPWDTKANTGSNKFAEDALIYSIGRKYADTNTTMHASGFDNGLTYGYEWYEVDGGMQDWAIYYRNSIHATVELSNTKHPSAGQLPNYWNQNQSALLGFIRQGMNGIHVKVVDGNGMAVNGVATTLSNRKISYPTNIVHRPTGQGLQDVTIESEGFKPLKIKLAPTTFAGSYQEVILER